MEYIAQKKGPVLQDEYPNRIYKESEYAFLRQGKQIVKGVITNEFLGIENKQELIKEVKKHITKNSSVTTHIYFANISDPEIIDKFYNPKTQGYCNLTKTNTNHMVSIIGWDDNYPKENFPEENRPSSDGAFLIMLYWKYFNVVYVSYEDLGILENLQGVLSCEY